MRRAIWIVGSLITVLVLAMITGFQPLYWLLYVAVVGAVIGYLWAWVQSRGLETDVYTLSPHPQVGQTVQIRVTVREKAGLPRMGLRARLVGDFVNMDEDEFSLRPRGTTSWTVSGFCQRRGLNNIGSLAIMSGDPSGLANLECRVGQPQTTLVYPPTVDLSRTLVEGQVTGGELGESGPLVGHSPAAFMVRQYIPGDSMTHIHWPTTARMNELMTKEFEGAGINEIWVFIDLQESVQVGTGENGTEEYCITIAASLIKSLILDGHAVGLMTQGDQAYRFSPAKDHNHMWSMMGALALARASGRTPLATLISEEGGNMGPGAVAMIVGPWTGPGISNLFQFLTRRGVLVVPIFLDTDSFSRPLVSLRPSDGRAEIQDSAFVVRRGDNLSSTLGIVLDRLASL